MKVRSKAHSACIDEQDGICFVAYPILEMEPCLSQSVIALAGALVTLVMGGLTAVFGDLVTAVRTVVLEVALLVLWDALARLALEDTRVTKTARHYRQSGTITL